MTIGEHIRNARKAANLTQAQLAEKSGVATISIHQYETGKRKPRLEQLTRIAKALEIHIFDLVGISEKMKAIRVESIKISSRPGRPPMTAEEEKALIEEILSTDQFELYDISSDETKRDFWKMLTEGGAIPEFTLTSSRERINIILDQMDEEGQNKVENYAEDILPRYRRQDAPELPADASMDTDTPTTETPPEDGETG